MQHHIQRTGARSDVEKNMSSNFHQTFASGFDGNTSLEKDVKGTKATRSKSLDHNQTVDNEIQSFDQVIDESSSDDQFMSKQRFKMDPTKKNFDQIDSSHLPKSGINKEYLNRIEPNHNAVHHEQLNSAMKELLSNQNQRFSKADKDRLSDRQPGKHKGMGAPRAVSANFEQSGQGSSVDLLNWKKSSSKHSGGSSSSSELKSNEYDHSSHSWESHKHAQEKPMPVPKFKQFKSRMIKDESSNENQEGGEGEKFEQKEQTEQKEWSKENTSQKSAAKKQKGGDAQFFKKSAGNSIKWEEDDVDPEDVFDLENFNEGIRSDKNQSSQNVQTIDSSDLFENKDQDQNQEEENFDESDRFDLDDFNSHIKDSSEGMDQKEGGNLEQSKDFESSDLQKSSEFEQSKDLKSSDSQQSKKLNKHEYHASKADLALEKAMQSLPKFNASGMNRKQRRALKFSQSGEHDQGSDFSSDSKETAMTEENLVGRAGDKILSEKSSKKVDEKISDELKEDLTQDSKSFNNDAYIGEDVDAQHGSKKMDETKENEKTPQNESINLKTTNDKPMVDTISQKQAQKGQQETDFANLQQPVESEIA